MPSQADHFLKSRIAKTRSLVILLLAVVGLSGAAWMVLRGPGMPLLPERTPAEWIIYPTPADGAGNWAVDLSSEFRRSFVIEQQPEHVAVLSICGFKRFTVAINGKAPGVPRNKPSSWKTPTEYEVGSLLRPGTNEISVTAWEDTGLPTVWLVLSTGKFQLVTDRSWLASMAGGTWESAQLAREPLPLRPGSPLYGTETSLEGFRSGVCFYLAVLAVLVVCGGTHRWWGPHLVPLLARPRGMWLIAALFGVAWVILWSNNLSNLPRPSGFDAKHHLEYISYILKKHALPLANEGFEMYQPPLYYSVAALLLSIWHLSPDEAGGLFVLRLFGLACGLGCIALVLLSLQLLFPFEPRKQVVGTLLAALFPPNLYLCHYPTNEMLSTTLIAGSIYACLRILTTNEPRWQQFAIAGAIIGLALLAKTSALILLPIGLSAIAWKLWLQPSRDTRLLAGRLALTLAACLIVCGWHYARVAARFGNPFIGNWDPQAGFSWRQQKGFRTISDYYHWGRSLKEPFFSALVSFPDGVYSTLWGDGLWGGESDRDARPPWQYHPMAAGYVLALVPSMSIAAGLLLLARWFKRQPRPREFLLLAVPGLLAMLLVYYSVKVPSYATAKAFYAFGALVPLCAFGAIGFEVLSRPKPLRWIGYLCLGLWAINSYRSFWIRHDGNQTQFLRAQEYSRHDRHDLSLATVSGMLSKWPHDPRAVLELTLDMLDLGNTAGAEKLAEASLTWGGKEAACHLALGSVRVVQGRLEEGIAEARRAASLAPDHPQALASLGDWLNRAGRREEATIACREAIRIRPAARKPHLILAQAASALGWTAEAQFHAHLSQILNDD